MNGLGLIIMGVQFTSDDDGLYTTGIGREPQAGDIVIFRIDHKTVPVAIDIGVIERIDTVYAGTGSDCHITSVNAVSGRQNCRSYSCNLTFVYQ